MNKWFGKVGFTSQVEIVPGVWEEQITEKEYFGDILKNTVKLQSTDQVNDNVNIANRISIVADPFAYEHFHDMRYVEFYGVKRDVSDVEVQYPRLVLSIGGVYNA